MGGRDGEHAACLLRRALEYATGQPIEDLGFRAADERYGLNRREALGLAAGLSVPLAAGKAATAAGPLTGIWHSRYEYVSSGRGGQTFAGEHYVVMIQHGDKIQVRSLPQSASHPDGTPSAVMMDLVANGAVVTGTWTEQTDPNGYYRGAVYHGAIQLLAEPSGRRLSGKWVGFGRDFDVNTGPWTFDLVSSDTSREAIGRFSKPAGLRPSAL